MERKSNSPFLLFDNNLPIITYYISVIVFRIYICIYKLQLCKLPRHNNKTLRMKFKKTVGASRVRSWRSREQASLCSLQSITARKNVSVCVCVCYVCGDGGGGIVYLFLPVCFSGDLNFSQTTIICYYYIFAL
jgi:hypothetical protein